MDPILNSAKRIDATICLYGNHSIGAGWLASLRIGSLGDALLNESKSFGTGEPNANLGFTGAVWAARDALLAAELDPKATVTTAICPSSTLTRTLKQPRKTPKRPRPCVRAGWAAQTTPNYEDPRNGD